MEIQIPLEIKVRRCFDRLKLYRKLGVGALPANPPKTERVAASMGTESPSRRREALQLELSAIQDLERQYRGRRASVADEMAHASRLLRLDEVKKQLAELDDSDSNGP